MIGAESKEIVFTSGATESNNLAIKGVAHFYKEKKNQIVTTQTVLTQIKQVVSISGLIFVVRNINVCWIRVEFWSKKDLK